MIFINDVGFLVTKYACKSFLFVDCGRRARAKLHFKATDNLKCLQSHGEFVNECSRNIKTTDD